MGARRLVLGPAGVLISSASLESHPIHSFIHSTNSPRHSKQGFSSHQQILALRPSAHPESHFLPSPTCRCGPDNWITAVASQQVPVPTHTHTHQPPIPVRGRAQTLTTPHHSHPLASSCPRPRPAHSTVRAVAPSAPGPRTIFPQTTAQRFLTFSERSSLTPPSTQRRQLPSGAGQQVAPAEPAGQLFPSETATDNEGKEQGWVPIKLYKHSHSEPGLPWPI